jgi:sporulation protein YlmC with PRC-barrel domain
LVATAPVAYAETAPHSRTVAATGGETMIQPDQIRASKMIGSTVYDVQNRSIGHVKDLVLDRDGQVASVIVMSARSWAWAENTSPSICGISRPITIG